MAEGVGAGALIALALGFFASAGFPSASPTVVTTVSTYSVPVNSAITTTVSSTSRSNPTTTATVQAVMLSVASASLTVKTNGTFLALTLVNDQDYELTNCTILLSSVKLAVVPELRADAQMWIEIQVPTGLAVVVGQTYNVSVEIQQYSSVQAFQGVVAVAG